MADNLEVQSPQENSATGSASAHDWPEDFEHENGAYMNVCVECKVTFIGYKRRLLCKVCVLKQGPVLGPKPEGKLW